MPESGLQAAERPTAERLSPESQILGDTGDLSEYRSKWTAGGELPDSYAKLALFTQPAPNGLEVAVVEAVPMNQVALAKMYRLPDCADFSFSASALFSSAAIMEFSGLPRGSCI